jgi:hypothetical protein
MVASGRSAVSADRSLAAGRSKGPGGLTVQKEHLQLPKGLMWSVRVSFGSVMSDEGPLHAERTKLYRTC